MWSSPGKHLVLTVKSDLSWLKIYGGVQVNEILTFSEVFRAKAYSRHENKHTHKLNKPDTVTCSLICCIDANINKEI